MKRIYNMKNILTILFISALLFTACDSNKEKKTKDGVSYTLLSSENGEAYEEGDYATYFLKMINSKDSVLIDSEEVGQMPLLIDSASMNPRGELFSVLRNLNVGDSIKTEISANEVYTKGFRQPLSPDMPADEVITIYVKALAKYDSAGIAGWQQEQMAAQQAKDQKDAEAQKPIDDKLIQAYLADNNLEAQKTESGLYYIIEEEGTGETPNPGDNVKVHYAGKLMDGTLFDTSMEEVAKANDKFREGNEYAPIEFPVGQGNVIPGWDEGLLLLKEGAKAKFIIPSGLAYGPRQRSAEIVANSILIFDVELVEVQ